MGVVYRYTDLADETVKYIGIVWSGNRTLKQRVCEHSKYDDWCKDSAWRIEYLKRDIQTRTDAEMLEAHYISKYGTDEFYNVKKKGWGTSEFIDDEQEEWELYSTDEEQLSDLRKSAEITDLRCDNWHEKTFFGKHFFPAIETTLDKKPVVFGFSKSMLPFKVYPAGKEMSPCYLEVSAVELLLKYIRHLGFATIEQFVEEGSLVIETSEVDGTIESIALPGDTAWARFGVSSDPDCDGYYDVEYVELYDETCSDDAERFFIENNVPLYDYVCWNGNDEDQFLAQKLIKNALKTGRIFV